MPTSILCSSHRMSEEEQTVRSSGTPEAAAVANVRTLQDVQRDIQKENVEFFYQARKEYRGAVSAYDAAWTASKSDPTNKVLSEDLAHAKEFRDIYKRLLDISEAHLEELEAERAQLQAAANRASEQKSKFLFCVSFCLCIVCLESLHVGLQSVFCSHWMSSWRFGLLRFNV